MTGPIRKIVGAHASLVKSFDTGLARGERFFRKLTPTLSEATKQTLSFISAASLIAGLFALGGFSFDKIKEFDATLASVRSITGKSVKDFLPYRQAIIDTAKDTKTMSTSVTEAVGKIASLNATFLENEKSLAQVTRASIVLKKASGDELGASAENLVGIMNQFDLAANQADRTMNVLAAGAGVGASSITQSAEAYKNFGSVAKGANITLEQSQGLIQTVGKFNIFAAEAGTKLRGAVLQLQKAGVGYASGQFQINDALLEAKKRIDALKTAKQKDRAVLKLFGAENITTGKILLANIDLFNEFTKGVTGTNAAVEQAAINTDTLSGALDEVKAAWVNMITGSNKTTKSLESVKKVLRFVADNMDTIVSIGGKILAFFIAWKALLIAARVAIIAYNIALGITGAVSGVASVAIGSNAVALGAYKVALWVATAAQWALNVALTANPIGIIIVAIGALIALLAVVVVKWNEWGAALTLFMGPLGTIVSLIMLFRKNWDLITDAFTNGGIIAGIKAIGFTLLEAFIFPVKQVLELIAKFTGAEWASKAVSAIDLVTNQLRKEVEVINPKAAEQEALTQKMETVQKQNVAIDIKDQTGRASVSSDNNFIPIRLTSTAMSY